MKDIAQKLTKLFRKARINYERHFSESKDVQWSLLAGLPTMEPILIGSGVSTVRLPLPGAQMVFHVDYEPFGSLGKHQHSDCTEYIYVSRGTIIDQINFENYSENSWLKLPPAEIHHITAGENGAVINVFFIKTKNYEYHK